LGRLTLFANLANLVRYRGLIQSLVARELKARYRGSVLGFFWSFINPLLLLLVYSFVFTYVLENKVEGIQPYALFMFCGILPWTWFSSSLTEAAGSLISGGNLIKKVLFPAEVLPIVSVLANMVHFFLGLTILVGFLIYYKHPPDALDLVWFPVVVVVQLIFTTALALLLAALTVHFRDIRDLLSNILTLWFFATPIIYPWTQANVIRFRRIFNLNPFTHLAISYQEILFFPGAIGHWKWLLALGAFSIVLFLCAYWVFDRLRDSFAEAV
jgi:ABC-type polysaccharide/polyol phosphate export permease